MPRLPRRLVVRRNESSSEALFRVMRAVARAGRRAQDQTFYSLREVAGHFHVPMSSVSRVFARLETEGLLGRVRGARTILRGRKVDRHLYVRGVVGIPVSIFRFSAFAGYRSFVTHLRRKLRQRGFMPAAIFYQHQESRGHFLAQSFFEAKSDVVVWLSPRRDSQLTMAALGDAGIRVIGVSDTIGSAIPCRYRIERQEALRDVLRTWRKAGTPATLVVTAERGASPDDEESYRAISDEELLPSRVVTLRESEPPQAFERIFRMKNCGLLLTKSGAAYLAVRLPELFARLTKERRVALVQGPISVTFAAIPATVVDLVAVDWERVAERIVANLIDGTASSVARPVVFKARSHLRMDLARCCQRL